MINSKMKYIFKETIKTFLFTGAVLGVIYGFFFVCYAIINVVN